MDTHIRLTFTVCWLTFTWPSCEQTFFQRDGVGCVEHSTCRVLLTVGLFFGLDGVCTTICSRELENVSSNLHLDPGPPATNCCNWCIYLLCDLLSCCANSPDPPVVSVSVERFQCGSNLLPDSTTVFKCTPTDCWPEMTSDDTWPLHSLLCKRPISLSTRFDPNCICALPCFMTHHKMFQSNWINFPNSGPSLEIMEHKEFYFDIFLQKNLKNK